MKHELQPEDMHAKEKGFWEAYYSLYFDDTESVIGYSLGKDLRADTEWNDDGFFIKLTGDNVSDMIQWLWNNTKDEMENSILRSSLILERHNGNPTAICVKATDKTMANFFNMDDHQQLIFLESLVCQHHIFGCVAGDAIKKYYDSAQAGKREFD